MVYKNHTSSVKKLERNNLSSAVMVVFALFRVSPTGAGAYRTVRLEPGQTDQRSDGAAITLRLPNTA